MTDSHTSRPIWIAEDQRDALMTVWQHDLRAAEGDDYLVIPTLVDAWDAAPPNPYLAACFAAVEYINAHDSFSSEECVRAVLAALGAPHASDS